jgi:hypothetical protein
VWAADCPAASGRTQNTGGTGPGSRSRRLSHCCPFSYEPEGEPNSLPGRPVTPAGHDGPPEPATWRGEPCGLSTQHGNHAACVQVLSYLLIATPEQASRGPCVQHTASVAENSLHSTEDGRRRQVADECSLGINQWNPC